MDKNAPSDMQLDPLYSSYSEFKGWHGESDSAGDPAAFAELMERAGRPHPARVLEIGFGEGHFLDWAKARGHHAQGVEILPESVEAARARGHEVFLGAAPEGVQVDVIVALDVLEHLDREALTDFFAMAERSLQPGGVVVARFPNAASPFFGPYQFSDMTHLKPMSAEGLGQLASLRGFEVIKAVNPRPLPAGWRSRIKARLAYAARDVIEIVLGYVYFGHRKPMDPNVLVVLGRRGGSRATA